MWADVARRRLSLQFKEERTSAVDGPTRKEPLCSRQLFLSPEAAHVTAPVTSRVKKRIWRPLRGPCCSQTGLTGIPTIQ